MFHLCSTPVQATPPPSELLANGAARNWLIRPRSMGINQSVDGLAGLTSGGAPAPDAACQHQRHTGPANPITGLVDTPSPISDRPAGHA